MKRIAILVKATWDDEAQVWVAQSEDLPGLVTEAHTLEALRARVFIMIPELLELNGTDNDWPEIPVQIIAEQPARIPNPRFS